MTRWLVRRIQYRVDINILYILQDKTQMDKEVTKPKPDDYDVVVRELIFEARGKVRYIHTNIDLHILYCKTYLSVTWTL